jgi:hypothetical protein
LEKVTVNVSTTPLIPQTIPVRVINRPPSRAVVSGNIAAWYCICGSTTLIRGRSGPAGGPTPDSVVKCEACRKNYFVIPMDQSHGPPIEVVELYEMPGETPAATPSPN